MSVISFLKMQQQQLKQSLIDIVLFILLPMLAIGAIFGLSLLGIEISYEMWVKIAGTAIFLAAFLNVFNRLFKPIVDDICKKLK